MAKQKPNPGGPRKVEVTDVSTQETKLDQARVKAKIINYNLSAKPEDYFDWAKTAREAKVPEAEIQEQLRTWMRDRMRQHINEEIMRLIVTGEFEADPTGEAKADREHEAVQQQRREGLHRRHGVTERRNDD